MYTVIYATPIAKMFGYSMMTAYIEGAYLYDEKFDDFMDAVVYARKVFGEMSMVVPTSELD